MYFIFWEMYFSTGSCDLQPPVPDHADFFRKYKYFRRHSAKRCCRGPQNLLMNIVSNPVDALVNANYIGILAWAIIFGIALKAASETTKTVIENISDATSTAVRWIISLAPFGIMG